MTQTLQVAWVDALREQYLAGEASLFLVHGNVRDLQPWVDGDRVEWLDLSTCLMRLLGRSRDILVRYDVSSGLEIPDAVQARRARAVLEARASLDGRGAPEALPRDVPGALEVVDTLIRDRSHRVGVILDFFEMVVPRADAAFLGHEEKAARVRLQRWASDPAVLSTDNLVVMITQTLADVAPDVVSSPQLALVQVPYPDLVVRRRWLQDTLTDGVELGMSLDALAEITAGLTLIQLRGLVQAARHRGQPLDFAKVAARKKAIVERECRGLVELVEPGHDLSHVGGMPEVVDELERVARDVREGRRRRVPMGMILVGPMGTGKTFVAEAFAASSGLTCLTLKNFRDRWVGSTEANLERVLELVEALGYVLLIIDEAERALATGDQDGGTNSRVIARLKQFMSDTSRRGRVVIMMMTNRPDKLDTDLKRPGRFDLKIPFFVPGSDEARADLLDALIRKNGVALGADADLGPVARGTNGYSGAELEAVLLAAVRHGARHEREEVSAEDLDAALGDVIPSRDVDMLAYMEMLAVFECSARRMLPPAFRELSTSEVLARLAHLRGVLGRRV